LLSLAFCLRPLPIGVVTSLLGVYALYATHCRWSACFLHRVGLGRKNLVQWLWEFLWYAISMKFSDEVKIFREGQAGIAL